MMSPGSDGAACVNDAWPGQGDRTLVDKCSSPKTYHGLEVGKHIFRVYAIDPSGKKGDPRVIRFTVTN
jgi:hypothetical protein